MQLTNEVDALPQEIREHLSDPNSLQEFAQGQDLVQSVLTRSTTDLEFRGQLVENPQAAIADLYREERGHPIPAGMSRLDLRFVENEGDVAFVLPPAIDAEAALSDTELEAVAGGGTVVTIAITLSTCFCLGVAAGAVVAGIVIAAN